MDLVDDLCREDRVRDMFQPRLHDAPKAKKWNNAECKDIRFGGRNFVTFTFDLTDTETWVHEFTEHSVHYVIERNIGRLKPRWPWSIFYRPVFEGAGTPWHILAALSTCGVIDGSDRLSPDEYWTYLKSSRVQSRLTEFIKKEFVCAEKDIEVI